MMATHARAQSGSMESQSPRRFRGRRKEESYIHFLARESQFYLEIIIIASLIATIVLMISFFFYAFIPLIILLLAYGLLVLANVIERSTEPGEPFGSGELEADWARARGDAARPRQRRPLFQKAWGIRSEHALRRRLIRVTIEVLVGAGLLALVMATIMLPRELVFMGIGVIFCYIVLISSPVWLAWLNDEFSDEQKRQAKQV